MRLPSKTTALVLAGAVGISSVAYGIGTQTDGGSANAARDNGAQRGDRGPNLSGVADELGVTRAELRDALSDFFRTQRDNHKDDFAAALAAALGKSTEEVQAAFDSLREKKEARFAAKLAAALGVETDQVATALDELEQEFENEGPGPGGPGDFAAALAEKLGVSEAKVESALRKIHRNGWRDHGRGGMQLGALAEALGVTRAELRTAFRELRNDRPERGDLHADLVKFLADRFGLSEEKVEAALPEFGGPGGRRGGPGGPPGGPGGFGGPGGPPGGPGGFGGPGGPGGFGGP